MINQERYETYMDRDLINYLSLLAETLGRCPTVTDMDESEDMPDVSTYERRFGSWHNALGEAGLRPKWNQGQEMLTDEIVRWMTEHCGRLPNKADCSRKNGLPSAQTLRNNFGSLGLALAMAEQEYVNLISSLEDPQS